MIIGITVLVLFLGVYIGLVLPYHLTRFMVNRDKKKELNMLSPTPVDEYRLCKEPHRWMQALSVDEKSEYVSINVCSVCGFLPSRDLMATKEGLERVLENNKLRDMEEAIQKEFQEKEKSDIKDFLDKYIVDSNVTSDKVREFLGMVYQAGQTSSKRYIIYKIARSEEMFRTKDNS